LKQVRKRLTYANVMSSIAVFLVLGGGAAVAAGLGKNSVGTPQIKRNAVKVGKLAPEAVKAGKLAKNAVPTNRLRDNAVSTTKVADEAVTSSKLAKDSVLTDKILNDAVTTGKLALESVGTGKIGKEAVNSGRLAPGSVVATKLGAIQRVVVESATATAEGQTRNVTANCPAGSAALSGGAAWVTVAGNVSTVAGILRVSHPVPSTGGGGLPTGWQATGELDANFERRLRAYAICIAQ
jgi:hypothetical protein